MFEALEEKGWGVVGMPEVDRDSLSPYFDILPEDKYLKGGSRRRRFSWFAGSPHNLM